MTTVWQIVDSSTIGGIEKHIAVLTESLRHRGIDARIILYQDHGNNPWIAQLKAGGLNAHHLDGTLSGLYRAMKSDRPALVHTHGYKAGILGRLTARALGIPSVTTFHMGEVPRWPVSLYAALDNATSFLSTRIAVSEEIKAKLLFDCVIIPNYIQMAREQPAFPVPPDRIGFVGRLSHEKAPDHFCTLARRFASHTCEWHIYGDGPMRAGLEVEFSNHVTFHGTVTDMATAWSSLGLCVMPSRGEGLPLASIEALNAGVPVIASDVGDLHKVIVNGISGWLVPSDNLGAFEAAIHEWINLSGAAKTELRNTAWQHASAHFSEHCSLPTLLNIYARLGVEAVVGK